MSAAPSNKRDRIKARENQCGDRDGSACLAINETLGWNDGVPWQTCDTCHCHGVSSEASQTIRDAYISKVLLTVERTIKQHKPEVVRAFADRHATKEKRAELLAWLAEKRPGWMYFRDRSSCAFNRMFRRAYFADKEREEKGLPPRNYKRRLIDEINRWPVPERSAC